MLKELVFLTYSYRHLVTGAGTVSLIAQRQTTNRRMNFYQPKDVNGALLPLIVIHWVLGMGVIEFPVGYRRPQLGLLYSIIMCIIYVILCVVAILHNVQHDSAKNYSIFLFVISSAFGPTLGVTIFNIVISIICSVKRSKCILELKRVNGMLERMGIVFSYKRFLVSQIWQLGCLVAMFIVIGTDQFISSSSDSKKERRISWDVICQDYAVSVITVNTMIFVNFNEMLTESFRHLNSLLESLRVKPTYDLHVSVNNLVQVNTVHKDKEKLEVLYSMRRIHLRLVRLARNWNAIHEPIIFSSILFFIWVITWYLYFSYEMLSIIGISAIATTDFMRSVFTMIFLLGKSAIVARSAILASHEAHRTCEVILEHLYPIASLRPEVRVFSMQLIQSPLRWSVFGLYPLDYTMLQQIIASAATYIVILAQILKTP